MPSPILVTPDQGPPSEIHVDVGALTKELHMKAFRRCFLFPIALILVLIHSPARTWAQTPHQLTAAIKFPSIRSYEIVNTYGDFIAVSNEGKYIFLCWDSTATCYMWNKETQELTLLAETRGIFTKWSVDNSQLITTDETIACPSDPSQYSLIRFTTQNQTVSRICVPAKYVVLDWSPIQSQMLYVSSRQILDTDTLQFVKFSPPDTLNPDDLKNYVGYGNNLWDVRTGFPAARMFHKRLDENIDGIIDHSELFACAFGSKSCVSIVNSLNYANADVFDWELYQNWLLWGGHLAKTGEAKFTTFRPEDRADTVLYLTDIATGTTQEIFRFSSLQLTDTYVNTLAWSPDGETIALSLKKETPIYQTNTLLLQLNW
ncbi:MAG TPA: hypothetical protein VHO69_04900 [Phototrophicaceae bacterium]|nr:hypothetical protein [Phototrophicaceae bacterium]